MIPKFKKGIKLVYHRPIKGEIKHATVSGAPTGKYFVSVLCDTGTSVPVAEPIKEHSAVGIDLGIKDFAITSEGVKYGNPKYLKANLARLKVLQRRASRKIKGSANRRKANLRVARQYEKIVNRRKDFLHKLSHDLVKNHDTICIENLAVSNMVKNHKLAQAISDVSGPPRGWAEFTRQLAYKCEWHGKNLIKIGRFEPSTKTCSTCGSTNGELTLADREWACADCDSTHDRDINAAKNVKAFGLLKHTGLERPGEPMELPTLVGAVK